MRFDPSKLKQLQERATSGEMASEDFQLLVALIDAHKELRRLLKDPNTTRADLARFLPPEKHDTATDDAAGDGHDLSAEGGQA